MTTYQAFDMQAFNADGLQAMLPSYEDKRIKTLVIKVDDEFIASGSLKWNLSKLAANHNIDIYKLKKRCAKILKLQYNVSIAIAPDLVLLPVKVRLAQAPGETTFGYVAQSAIDEITINSGSPGYSSYKLKSGHIIDTLHTATTLILRMSQGDTVAKHIFGEALPGEGSCTVSDRCSCRLVKVLNSLIHKN